MPGAFENQKTGVRVLFGVIIGMLAISMLLYLVPQGPGTAESATDVVATVGDQSVTLADIQQQLNEIRQRNQIPPQLESLYASQILKSLIFQKEVDYEATRTPHGLSASRVWRRNQPASFGGDVEAI